MNRCLLVGHDWPHWSPNPESGWWHRKCQRCGKVTQRDTTPKVETDSWQKYLLALVIVVGVSWMVGYAISAWS